MIETIIKGGVMMIPILAAKPLDATAAQDVAALPPSWGSLECDSFLRNKALRPAEERVSSPNAQSYKISAGWLHLSSHASVR